MAKNESRHLEELPQDAQSMVQLINEFFSVRVEGTPDNNDPTARNLMFRQQPDGTIRAYALQVYHDESKEEAYAVVGPSGQQFHAGWVYDWGASTWRAMAGEPTGEQRISLYGHDLGGTLDPLRTNPDQQLQVEPVKSRTIVAAVAIPAAEADVWDPSLTGADYLDIHIEMVNVDGAADATGVGVGVDYGDTGATDRWFCQNVTVPHSEIGIRLGTYRIGGGDVIRAVADLANDAELHIFVVDEGVAV